MEKNNLLRFLSFWNVKFRVGVRVMSIRLKASKDCWSFQYFDIKERPTSTALKFHHHTPFTITPHNLIVSREFKFLAFSANIFHFHWSLQASFITNSFRFIYRTVSLPLDLRRDSTKKPKNFLSSTHNQIIRAAFLNFSNRLNDCRWCLEYK